MDEQTYKSYYSLENLFFNQQSPTNEGKRSANYIDFNNDVFNQVGYIILCFKIDVTVG